MRRRLKQPNKRTFAGSIPGLVPIDGGDRVRGNVRKERRAANVGGERVGHDLVTPRVLQGPDALNGDVETPGEGHVPVRMATGHVDPAEEVLGDLSRYRVVVGREGNVWFHATRNCLRRVAQKEGKFSLFSTRLDDKAVGIDGSRPNPFHRVPTKVVIRDRIPEPSIRILLIRKLIMYDLAIESPVREIRPSHKRMMRHVRGRRVSQPPLVAIHELRPVRETVLGEEEPLFPTGPVVVDLERVDADLGLEERGGRGVVGKRVGELAVAGAVVVHGGGDSQ
jgi:hypothetical protein